MRPSLGVRISAVALFIGSLVPLVLGLLATLSFFSPPVTLFPGGAIFRAASTVMSLMAFGLASWAIASAVGLFGLRYWARASVLVMSSLMIYLSLPPVFLVPFWQIRYVGVTPVNFTEAGRITVAVVYSAFMALGIFWLYFFNKRSVKAQFRPAAAT